MFILKIRWMRYEWEDVPNGSPIVDTVGESTLFIPADKVTVNGLISSYEELKTWDTGSYFDYVVRTDRDNDQLFSARMIHVEEGGQDTWYLASYAWLVGPDGKTIERLT